MVDKKSEAVSQDVVAAAASPGGSGPADLIRQLNLARAQGLVVLQQWGDKQVGGAILHNAQGVF